MAAASAVSQPFAPAVARSSSVIFLLRFEGLAMAAFSVFLYARTGLSWWLFAALFLAPDLSMLGYLAGPCWGARIYNAVHTYITPAALALCGLFLHEHVALAVAFIWASHIGMDRMLGYGLKYADGFGYTHLGRLGKSKA
jgi:Domain of unknown function (DUF4260)